MIFNSRNTARDKFNYGIGLWRMTDCSGSYNAPCKDMKIPETYDKRKGFISINMGSWKTKYMEKIAKNVNLTQ